MTTEAPTFAYEEISDEVENENVTENDENETVDLATLDPDERLAYLHRMAEELANMRREKAALQEALSKAYRTPSTRAKKDLEQGERILGHAVRQSLKELEFRTTEKDDRPKIRFVNSVDVTNEHGHTKRYHATLVVAEAKRG